MKTFEIFDTKGIEEHTAQNIEKEYILHLVLEGEKLVICNNAEYKVLFIENEGAELLKSLRFNPLNKTYFQAVKEAFWNRDKKRELYIVKVNGYGFEPVHYNQIHGRIVKQVVKYDTNVRDVRELTFAEKRELKKLVKKIRRQVN